MEQPAPSDRYRPSGIAAAGIQPGRPVRPRGGAMLLCSHLRSERFPEAADRCQGGSGAARSTAFGADLDANTFGGATSPALPGASDQPGSDSLVAAAVVEQRLAAGNVEPRLEGLATRVLFQCDLARGVLGSRHGPGSGLAGHASGQVHTPCPKIQADLGRAIRSAWPRWARPLKTARFRSAQRGAATYGS